MERGLEIFPFPVELHCSAVRFPPFDFNPLLILCPVLWHIGSASAVKDMSFSSDVEHKKQFAENVHVFPLSQDVDHQPRHF